VHQAVLVHAQVDEGAELRHVADRALQHHARLQVLDVLTPSLKRATLKSGRGSRPGFSSSARMSLTVMAPKRVVGKQASGLSVRSTSAAAHQLVPPGASSRQHLLHHRVGLGVHAGHVQRVVAVADAQEARRLLEGRGPRPVTSSSCWRLRKAPCASRQRTMLAATAALRPDTRDSSGRRRC
jgi:hypothetical protein